LGGVARRATVIKAAKASSQYFLLLDAGNSLSNEFTTTAEVPAANGGKTAVEALNRLGYDAVALGDLDLHMGRAALQERLAELQGVNMVSANVTDKATGKLLVKPYVVKELGGHHIALIGITAPVKDDPDFAVAPPLDAAKEYVAKAKAEADIIILLSNAGAETNKTIAAQLPDVDLIISGGQDQLDQPAQPTPNSLVVQADLSSSGHAGRYIGKLVATFDPSGKLVTHDWQKVELNPSVGDDPSMKLWVDSLPKAQPTEPPTQQP